MQWQSTGPDHRSWEGFLPLPPTSEIRPATSPTLGTGRITSSFALCECRNKLGKMTFLPVSWRGRRRSTAAWSARGWAGRATRSSTPSSSGERAALADQAAPALPSRAAALRRRAGHGHGFALRELERCRLRGRDGLCLGLGITPGRRSHQPGCVCPASEYGVHARHIPASHEHGIPHPLYSAAGNIWCRWNKPTSTLTPSLGTRMPSPESPLPSGSGLQKPVRCFRNKLFSQWRVSQSQTAPAGPERGAGWAKEAAAWPHAAFPCRSSVCLWGRCLRHGPQLGAHPGKQAVVWWMGSMPLARPWEQFLPWVLEQGLPCPATAPHRVAACGQLLGSTVLLHSKRLWSTARTEAVSSSEKPLCFQVNLCFFVIQCVFTHYVFSWFFALFLSRQGVCYNPSTHRTGDSSAGDWWALWCVFRYETALENWG